MGRRTDVRGEDLDARGEPAERAVERGRRATEGGVGDGPVQELGVCGKRPNLFVCDVAHRHDQIGVVGNLVDRPGS
jgi:hypothetical protein